MTACKALAIHFLITDVACAMITCKAVFKIIPHPDLIVRNVMIECEHHWSVLCNNDAMDINRTKSNMSGYYQKRQLY